MAPNELSFKGQDGSCENKSIADQEPEPPMKDLYESADEYMKSKKEIERSLKNIEIRDKMKIAVRITKRLFNQSHLQDKRTEFIFDTLFAVVEEL